MRQSNVFERSVNNQPKTFPLSTYFFHFSNIVKRQCWTIAFPKFELVFWKKIAKDRRYFSNKISKTFDKVGSILSFLPLFCNGVTVVRLKELRNTDDLNAALVLLNKKSANMSAFYLTILVRLWLFWEAFLQLNVFTFFSIFSMVTCLNQKILFSRLSLLRRLIRWFLILK